MAKQVLIVGGGVIGLCAALYCARRGLGVTLVERNGEERDGCSYGNTGIVVPSHFVPLAAPGMVALGLKWMCNPRSPFYVRPRASWDLVDWGLRFWRAATVEHVRRAAPLLRDLAHASRGCHEELAAERNDFAFEKSGTLLLTRTAHGLDEEAKAAEHACSLGIDAEVLDARQVAALEPGVRMSVSGAVLYPGDCRVAPQRLMASLQGRAARAGVRFAWHTDIAGWRTGGGRLRAAVTRTGAEIGADEFVLCAGAWSSELARALGVRIPMQAGKGYSLTFPQARLALRRCTILTEGRVAVTPAGGMLRVGGTMEIAGLNEDVNPIRVRAIVAAVSRYYPDLKPAEFDDIQPWRGLRPCSPDGLPYVGRTGRYANLVVATGHAMMGITLGPVTGRIAADILAGERPGIDLSLLSPDRYA